MVDRVKRFGIQEGAGSECVNRNGFGAGKCNPVESGWVLRRCNPQLLSKAPEGWRTPKPGGTPRHVGKRGSVLECGAAAPLWISISKSRATRIILLIDFRKVDRFIQ